MTTPHLHLGGGVAAWRPDFAKAHIPTGLVTLEDVLLLAIEELILDVEPLRARAIAFKFALAPQISVLNRNGTLIRPNISQLVHTNPQP